MMVFLWDLCHLNVGYYSAKLYSQIMLTLTLREQIVTNKKYLRNLIREDEFIFTISRNVYYKITKDRNKYNRKKKYHAQNLI